jgi:hypothetical protein
VFTVAARGDHDLVVSGVPRRHIRGGSVRAKSRTAI